MSASLRTLVVVPMDLPGLLQSFPAIEALVRSERSLVVLALEELHPLLRRIPGVELLVERGSAEGQTLAALRATDCNEAILLDDSWAAAWLALRSGIERRWGYRGWFRSVFLRPPVDRSSSRWPGGERFRELLAAIDVGRPRSWVPTVALNPDERARGAELLRRSQLEPGEGLLVGLVPSSERSGAAIWPWRRHAELAQTLRRRNPSVRLLILARRTDLWDAVRIHEETARFLPVLGPDLDWTECAAVASRLDLVIGPDSGLLHLAAAAGVPTVGLLSRRAAGDAEPAGEGHRLLRGRRLATSFLSRGRPLLDIAVPSVVRAGERILGLEEDSPG